jgi:hypothetical protein
LISSPSSGVTRKIPGKGGPLTVTTTAACALRPFTKEQTNVKVNVDLSGRELEDITRFVVVLVDSDAITKLPVTELSDIESSFIELSSMIHK